MRVAYVFVVAFNGLVHHVGLGRVAEHLRHIEVERLDTVALYEREVCVARGFADHIQRGTLALGYLAHVFDMFFVNEQAHALLTFVCYNLLARQCLVADGQLGHVYLAAALLDKLRQTVDVACRTVVVDADNRVDIFLAQGAHKVVCTLLHLGVGTLHGVKLDAVAVTAGINRRHAAAAETDAVVVAADNHDLVALLRLLLQAVALRAVADASGKHDNLVVSVLLVAFLVFESKHGTRDERLAELVAEV